MKKTLLFWVIVSLCSCSVQRSVESSQQIDSQQNEQSEQEACSVVDQAIEQVAEQEQIKVTTIEQFDTSQPINPLTGTPPLKSRTQTQSHKKMQVATTTQTAATITQVHRANTTTNSQSQITESEQVKRKFGTNALIWGILGAVAMVAGLLFWKQIKQRYNPF